MNARFNVVVGTITAKSVGNQQEVVSNAKITLFSPYLYKTLTEKDRRVTKYF